MLIKVCSSVFQNDHTACVPYKQRKSPTFTQRKYPSLKSPSNVPVERRFTLLANHYVIIKRKNDLVRIAFLTNETFTITQLK